MEYEEIETIAVLGAGSMGHGIAEVAALAGYDVRLRDINDEFVQKGYENIEWSLDKLVEHDQLTREEADAALDRVTPLVDIESAIEGAQFVIEAVPERIEVKKNVYREAEQYADDDTLFATNTSSLSITDLSEVTERPGQFCGMHFFNPPVRMQLVEVIAGAHTLDDTLETTEALAEAMGKTPVWVRKDSPGFIVNRVLTPLMNEAAWLVHGDEATVEGVDSAVNYDLGLPMGAFELTDQVGIDVAYHVLDYLHEELGDAYEPCPMLVEKVEREELGKKSGQGFYDYEDGRPEIPTDAGDERVARLLRAVMANEVAKLVGADVADVAQIDQAVELGAGFPDGPAKMADDAGLETLFELLAERHEETGAARYEPSATLQTIVTESGAFYDDGDDTEQTYETITIERREGGVGHIVLDREHRLNTITVGMLDELEAAVDELSDDEDVRALLVTGAGGRAFSAGADVQSLASQATPLDGVEISRRGQRAFGRFEECDLPVVAGIDGYCLGGGMELATCADLRVASRGSELGQTEHTLGLLPGWGGTQRLRHLVGESRAKQVIFTGERLDAGTLHEWGFVNELDDDAEERALELARDLAAGPPVAQRFTKRAMLAGREDTEAGLEVEAQSFGLLMGTDDLMEGVSAFMDDRDPSFEGR